jgi:hypothetical protein
MPLFQGTQQQYYGQQSFTWSGGSVLAATVTLTFPNNPTLLNNLATMPNAIGQITVTRNGNNVTPTSLNPDTGALVVGPANNGDVFLVSIINPQYGNYQYISMQSLINNFIVAYVGTDKIIPRVKRADVAFHAQRCLQEFSYDILRSEKSQEIEIPPSLTMALPHDYVNYVKFSWHGNDGIERIIYPARQTSNPTAILQDGSFGYTFDNDGNLLTASQSDTWTNYSDNPQQGDDNVDDSEESYWYNHGRRYGINPENAQDNGVFYIDHVAGRVHFSSSLTGKTITIKYISDGLATDDEMLFHKFAEEAAYKWITYGILSSRTNVPEYIIGRYKKERAAAMRKAKIRLSNLKSEELAQIMRNKSKVIKH